MGFAWNLGISELNKTGEQHEASRREKNDVSVMYSHLQAAPGTADVEMSISKVTVQVNTDQLKATVRLHHNKSCKEVQTNST